jgi:2-iminobutanoate/2-iminopropanoate deaminase
MKKIIHPANAPAPLAPYNPGILVNNTLYASGQIAIDPTTGTLVLDNIEAETHQVMANILAILQAANMTFDNVVKCTIFLSDMGNYGRVNTIYGEYFQRTIAPARECVQVACLPRNVNIEISVIAVQ